MAEKKPNVHTIDDLRQMQALPLDVKVRMTKDRIRAFTNQFDAYVAFSGGKDSTVLLDIARQVVPDIPAVFVDTGLEYPEIRDFVKTVENVTWIKPKMNFKEVIRTCGYPAISKAVSHAVSIAKRYPSGNVSKKLFDPSKRGPYAMYKWRYLIDAPFDFSDKCCNIMKKEPAYDYAKRTGRMSIVGTMACESTFRLQNWIHHGCNVFDEKNARSAPISFWTEEDVLRYIKVNNLPYASIYGNIIEDVDGKLHTTGCMFCGFGAHLEKEPNRFQRMKQTHPKIWEYCMKPIDKGGLGMAEVLDFIGVKYDGEWCEQISLMEQKGVTDGTDKQ